MPHGAYRFIRPVSCCCAPIQQCDDVMISYDEEILKNECHERECFNEVSFEYRFDALRSERLRRRSATGKKSDYGSLVAISLL
ncbi:hypothetical protein KIN20_006622 [Parelaphostrongylus tenuis]|uniref:Uncharacterized protein n=1 Tax=Parelaphostrongylus tenuis TaxID=148309 RepID=A0AAD5M211_PARTN|nr:hypothetical protein KIN20_006622 [Parelaphostrongylus tenuis]